MFLGDAGDFFRDAAGGFGSVFSNAFNIGSNVASKLEKIGENGLDAVDSLLSGSGLWIIAGVLIAVLVVPKLIEKEIG